MRKRLVQGLDSLFRYSVWLCLSPLVGCVIGCGIARFVRPETPLVVLLALFTGGILGTAITLILMRILKPRIHPWVIAQVESMKRGSNA